MKIIRQLLTYVVVLSMFCIVTGGDDDVPYRKSPAKWLIEQQRLWRDNGWKKKLIFPDVIAAENPSTDEKEYFLILEDNSPLTRSQWRKKACKGCRYPDANRPFKRLAAGAMLYDSNPGRLAEYNKTGYEEELDKIFKTVRKLGLNSLVLCTYATPEKWSVIEKTAAKHDIKLIIQHHGAYFRPDRGLRYLTRISIPKSMAFLKSSYGSPQLIGFSIKEEPYLPLLAGMQCYYKQLKDLFPEQPFYVCFNASNAMTGVGTPDLEIMGTDLYPFLGGYFGGGRPLPNFYSPQKVLRGLAGTLKKRSHEAMKRGAVFTYTPTCKGYNAVHLTKDLSKERIPNKDFPGVMHLKNGFSIFWRRYAPPKNAMRASVWLGIASGCQGFFPWYFQPKIPWIKDKKLEEYTDLKKIQYDRKADNALIGSENSPVWQEYAATLKDLQKYSDVLMKLRPDGIPRFDTDDKLLIGRTFRFTSSIPGNAVILVNCDVGRWDGYPRVNMKKPFNLNVNEYGVLTGYTPLTEPRKVKFTLRLKPEESVYVLGNNQTLTPIASQGHKKEFEISIPPGDGRILIIKPDVASPK